MTKRKKKLHRIAKTLAKADGEMSGNTYAYTAYMAGGDCGYWRHLAKAALKSMKKDKRKRKS